MAIFDLIQIKTNLKYRWNHYYILKHFSVCNIKFKSSIYEIFWIFFHIFFRRGTPQPSAGEQQQQQQPSQVTQPQAQDQAQSCPTPQPSQRSATPVAATDTENSTTESTDEVVIEDTAEAGQTVRENLWHLRNGPSLEVT